MTALGHRSISQGAQLVSTVRRGGSYSLSAALEESAEGVEGMLSVLQTGARLSSCFGRSMLVPVLHGLRLLSFGHDETAV